MPKLNASGRDLLKQMQTAIEEVHGAKLERSWDPLIEMAVFAASPDLSKAQKFAANREIAQYIYAKRKAVELDADAGGMRIMLVQFSKSDNGFIIEQDQQPALIEDQSHASTRQSDPEPSGEQSVGDASHPPEADA